LDWTAASLTASIRDITKADIIDTLRWSQLHDPNSGSVWFFLGFPKQNTEIDCLYLHKSEDLRTYAHLCLKQRR
jgi:hypothetical protein